MIPRVVWNGHAGGVSQLVVTTRYATRFTAAWSDRTIQLGFRHPRWRLVILYQYLRPRRQYLSRGERKLPEHEERRLAVAGPTWQLASAVAVAIGVGIIYFLAARFSLSLLTKPDGVAVFWPASGVAAS